MKIPWLWIAAGVGVYLYSKNQPAAAAAARTSTADVLRPVIPTGTTPVDWWIGPGGDIQLATGIEPPAAGYRPASEYELSAYNIGA